jgi:hypothetical protein
MVAKRFDSIDSQVEHMRKNFTISKDTLGLLKSAISPHKKKRKSK